MDTEKSTVIGQYTSHEKPEKSTAAWTWTWLTSWKSSDATTFSLMNSNMKSFAISATPQN